MSDQPAQEPEGQRDQHDQDGQPHDQQRGHDHDHRGDGEHSHSHGLVDRSILRSRKGIKPVSLSLAVLALTAGAYTQIAGFYERFSYSLIDVAPGPNRTAFGLITGGALIQTSDYRALVPTAWLNSDLPGSISVGLNMIAGGNLNGGVVLYTNTTTGTPIRAFTSITSRALNAARA